MKGIPVAKNIARFEYCIVLICFLIITVTPLQSYSQNSNGTFTDGLVNNAVRSGINSLDKPSKKWYANWSYKVQHYHIPPYERKIYADCVKRAKSKCILDTFSYRGLNINAGITGAFGIADFSRSIEKGAYGPSFGLEYQPTGKAPISLGFNVNTLIAGVKNTKANLDFQVVDNGVFLETFSIPLQINIKNTVFNVNGALRVWLPTKYAQPYIQGIGGFLLSSTKVRIYEPNRNVLLGIEDDGLLYERNILSDVNWCAGGAAGIWINVSYGVNLDIKATYLHTGPIQYYTSQNIKNWQFYYKDSPGSFSNDAVQSNKLESVKANNNYGPAQLVAFTLGATFLLR